MQVAFSAGMPRHLRKFPPAVLHDLLKPKPAVVTVKPGETSSASAQQPASPPPSVEKLAVSEPPTPPPGV